MRLIRWNWLAGAALVACLALGCISDPWRQARSEDTLVGYRRYVTQFPDSKHAQEAHQRIDFLELVKDPSVDGFMRFEAEYPDSELTESLRPQMEAAAFEVARYAGTSAAYARFLEAFPEGRLADRARGNAAFLAAGGFTSNARLLEDFAVAHPESDYAEEARLSAEALRRRDERSFDRVGLVIRVAPGTAEVQRIAEEFSKRANAQYKRAGYRLVDVLQLQSKGRAKEVPRARLVIEHREVELKSSVSGGDFTRPGVLATTQVSLLEEAGGEPIWQREFQLRLAPEEHLAETSVLFSPNSERYWKEFFVPVASWPNQASIRPPVALDEAVVAIDSVGDRMVAMRANGEFDLLELASTSESVVLARYQRPKDLTRWKGVRILGSRVVLFGEDGLEIVAFGEHGPRPEARVERPVIGEIYAVERFGEEMVLASSRGLLLTDAAGGNPRRLLRRPVRGLTTLGDTIVFSDTERVYVSTVEMISQQKVLKQLKVGFEFGPEKLVSHHGKVLVLGKGGLIVLSVADPRKPEIVSRLESARIGSVQDAALVAGRVFLMGERGLQLLDRRATRVVETVDIAPSTSMSEMGRFLVTVRGKELQAVDTAPFLARRQLPAARSEAASSPAGR